MLRNSAAAAALFRLFDARFNPVVGRRSRRARRSGRSRAAPGAAAGRQPAGRRDRARRGEPAAGGGPHQRLPEARAAGRVDEGRVRQGGRHGHAAAAVRDLRPLAAPRGHPPARRQGRARRPALERPSRRLPHRGPRPDEDADGQERDHRAGRVQGRLRAEGAVADAPGARPVPDRSLPPVHLRPARHHRQHRRRQGGAPARRGAVRPARSVPGGRRRQGDGPPLRHGQLGVGAVRLLAGRRVRVGRQQRLRPQGRGHHGPRRVGVRAAPLPEHGPGHPGRAVHDGRPRRHVGRRVRQRHAAQPRDPARRGVQPPAHLPRPGPRHGAVVRRARASLRAAAVHVARLRHRRSSARAAASSIDRPRPSRSRRRSRRCSTSRPTRSPARR